MIVLFSVHCSVMLLLEMLEMFNKESSSVIAM